MHGPTVPASVLLAQPNIILPRGSKGVITREDFQQYPIPNLLAANKCSKSLLTFSTTMQPPYHLLKIVTPYSHHTAH
jgi:hypothetical protein